MSSWYLFHFCSTMAPFFTKTLLDWNNTLNNRPMPWKGEKDPYKIWLSEIILQQTRVEQGWAYYEKFVAAFPTIFDLAEAKDQKVFKLWEGLGYYNRCKNLLFTARQIVKLYKGVFPTTYETLVSQKGIGPYTAAAIASFAYNLPYAVVDGNVFRVFARFYGIAIPTDTKAGLLAFNKIASENLSKPHAGIYNQALMDFGATVCKPMAPLCGSCVMQKKCVAFKQNKVGQLPLKVKNIQKKKRVFEFYCFTHEEKWLIQKRDGGDIWEGLHQFYLVEQEKQNKIDISYVKGFVRDQLGIVASGLHVDQIKVSSVYHQALTHQNITAQFILVPLKKLPSAFSQSTWVTKQQMKRLAFPKIINSFFEDALF